MALEQDQRDPSGVLNSLSFSSLPFYHQMLSPVCICVLSCVFVFVGGMHSRSFSSRNLKTLRTGALLRSAGATSCFSVQNVRGTGAYIFVLECNVAYTGNVWRRIFQYCATLHNIEMYAHPQCAGPGRDGLMEAITSHFVRKSRFLRSWCHSVLTQTCVHSERKEDCREECNDLVSSILGTSRSMQRCEVYSDFKDCFFFVVWHGGDTRP